MDSYMNRDEDCVKASCCFFLPEHFFRPKNQRTSIVRRAAMQGGGGGGGGGGGPTAGGAPSSRLPASATNAGPTPGLANATTRQPKASSGRARRLYRSTKRVPGTVRRA